MPILSLALLRVSPATSLAVLVAFSAMSPLWPDPSDFAAVEPLKLGILNPPLLVEESRATNPSFIHFLREKGIGVNLHYIPIYRHPFYEKFNFDKNMYPNSESYYNSAISIPMYPELTENELSYVVKSVKEAIA